jgi:hypothetical protein
MAGWHLWPMPSRLATDGHPSIHGNTGNQTEDIYSRQGSEHGAIQAILQGLYNSTLVLDPSQRIVAAR